MDTEHQRQLEAALSAEDVGTFRVALAAGQEHLFTHWPTEGAEDQKRGQLAQLRALDGQYPGGLRAYADNARRLLAAAAAGDNPYEGFTPAVPDGEKLTLGSDACRTAEQEGVKRAGRTVFVLVAGGLGERLGYSGIKIALPSNSLDGRPFIALYAAQILALQALSAKGTGEMRKIPLVVMTSGDTDEATRDLLQSNSNFGLDADQITIVKQEKVPAICDNEARFAQEGDNPYSLQTKPHGHGDVHVLLQQSGLAQRFLGEGYEYLAFFQDTNALVFNALVATLGVSARKDFDFNTLVVPRRAGEAAGGIVRLEGAERALTINVEYNQLDPLLRATVDPKGDVPDESGYSPYPGNTNAFVIKLSSYVETLNKSGGAIPEFVNPKYADESRTKFKKPTRLECMMQDYPKLLPEGAQVGFTQFPREQCFSAVKNNVVDAADKQKKGLPAECALTGEADFYAFYRQQLALAGVEIESASAQTFAGIEATLFPLVVLDPSFAAVSSEVPAKVKGVSLSARSALHVAGPDVMIESLKLDGALRIEAVPGAKVTIRNLVVENGGILAEPAGEDAPEPTAIRGFTLRTAGEEVLRFETPGTYVVDGSQ